jgi:hypothetical protein
MGSDGSITTFSGMRFWPLIPNPADIRIEDIAHALSNQCRFAGHSREFYSVAEHSVRVSQHCRPEDALWGLLHDASEAYLSDVPAPLKELPAFEAYRAAERSLQGTIAVRFGLSTEQPRSVTEADRASWSRTRGQPFCRVLRRFADLPYSPSSACVVNGLRATCFACVCSQLWTLVARKGQGFRGTADRCSSSFRSSGFVLA